MLLLVDFGGWAGGAAVRTPDAENVSGQELIDNGVGGPEQCCCVALRGVLNFQLSGGGGCRPLIDSVLDSCQKGFAGDGQSAPDQNLPWIKGVDEVGEGLTGQYSGAADQFHADRISGPSCVGNIVGCEVTVVGDSIGKRTVSPCKQCCGRGEDVATCEA